MVDPFAPASLHERLSRVAQACPDGIAVEDERGSLTFAEFWNAASGLALELTSGTAGSILLSMDKSVEGVVGYWAAFLAGRRITPISPGWPASRRAALARAVEAGCVLVASAGPTGSEAADGSEAIGSDAMSIPRLDVSAAVARLRGRPPSQALADAAPGDADAYVLFTSGTTGRPKGVRISRDALTAYVEIATENTGLRPGDRVSHNIDYTFDPSVFDVFVTISAGATVCVPHRGERLRPVAFVTRARLTHWCSVPSLIGLADRLGSLTPAAMPTLRHSMFLGEALLRSDAQLWRRAAPASVLANAYGPTEVTNTCSELRVDVGADLPATSNGTLPIGWCYPGLDWGVLDVVPPSDGGPGVAGLPYGTKGELVVRGAQRLTSYLAPEDNAERFAEWVSAADPAGSGPAGSWRTAEVVPPPGVSAELAYRTGDLVEITPDGMVHLGRTDRQVKVRGQRVEPAEVEHLLREVLGARRVAVFPERQGMETRLAAVVEVDDPLPGSTREVDGDGEFWRADPWPAAPPIGELRGLLPAHLIPARWVAVSRFPSNARGKIDLDRLRQMAAVELR